MDYLSAVNVTRAMDSWAKFEAWRAEPGRRLVLLTTKGEASLWDFAFHPDDIILVGRESAGAPGAVHLAAAARLRIPIRPPLRSLNVGVAATIAMVEALRQIGRLPADDVEPELRLSA